LLHIAPPPPLRLPPLPLLLLQALRVSVGKLGIIARVHFRVVKEVPVLRVLKALTPSELLALMQEASAGYVANSSIPHWMNETQIFWVVQKNQVRCVWDNL
jgi:hypothetical protein